MIRTKGEAGTGDVVEAVRHMRAVNAEISKAKALDVMELRVMAKEIGAPYDLLKETAERGRLRTYSRIPNHCFLFFVFVFPSSFGVTLRCLRVVCLKDMSCSLILTKNGNADSDIAVVNFSAGGVATPADAALMMQLGCDGVFVGSGIFKSGNAALRARAIVQAVTHFRDAKILAEVSENLGEAMVGLNVGKLSDEEKLAKRGW